MTKSDALICQSEALHYEINGWFRSTAQIHRATLALKLEIMSLCKLLIHNAAMYQPTARTEPSSVVKSRVVCRQLWTAESWKAWCQELHGNSRMAKAVLPNMEAFAEQAKKLSAWIRKRPAGNALPKARLKRTAFNLVRAGNFRKGGVKSTIFKRPAAAIFRKPSAAP